MRNTTSIAASASLSFFTWGMMGVSIGALLPNMMAEFSLSSMAAGLLFVLWSIGFMGGSLVAERALRFKGPPVVLAALSGSTAALSFAQAMVAQPPWFFTIYALLGVCGGAIFTASHTLFGTLYADRRASALAILDVVFSLGNMAGPLVVIAILRAQLAWHSVYALLSIGFLVVTLCFASQMAGRLPDELGSGHEEVSRTTGLRAVPIVTTASVAIASFSLGAVEWTQNVWSVTFLIDKGLAADVARIGLSAFTAGMIVCRIIVIGAAKVERSPVAVWSMYGAALAGELLIVTSSGSALPLIGNALLGLGIGGLFPIFLGRAMDRFPTIGATMSMLMIVSLTLGGQTASFALGVLAQDLGITLAFLVTIPAVATMAAAFEIVRRETAPNASA